MIEVQGQVAMNQPIQFPNQYDVIREEAERHLRLNSLQRLRISAELMVLGEKLVSQNPHRDRVNELQTAQETAWQQAQRRIFAQHEARHASHL